MLDPGTLDLVPRFEELRDAAAELDPVLHDAITGELISSEIEIISGRGRGSARRDRAPARPAPAAVHARPQPRHRPRLDRHAPLGRLPRAAQHRHRALPPRRRGPGLRRAAQQHVLAARPRRRARRRPRGRRLRSPAPGPAAAARRQRQLAVSRRSGHAPALRAQPDLHEVLSALRRARRVRRLADVSRVHRAADRDAVDRRVHAGVVVGATARLLRHRRGAHLRRAGDGRRVRGPRLAHRGVRGPGAARHRRRRPVRRSAPPAPRGEHVARDPLRARRHA